MKSPQVMSNSAWGESGLKPTHAGRGVGRPFQPSEESFACVRIELTGKHQQGCDFAQSHFRCSVEQRFVPQAPPIELKVSALGMCRIDQNTELPFCGCRALEGGLQTCLHVHQTKTPGAPCRIALSRQLLQAARGIMGSW
jgi:hypothetical protein